MQQDAVLTKKLKKVEKVSKNIVSNVQFVIFNPWKVP